MWLQSGPDLDALVVGVHPGRLRVKPSEVTDKAPQPFPLQLRAPVLAHASDLASKPLPAKASVLAALLRDRHPVVQGHAVGVPVYRGSPIVTDRPKLLSGSPIVTDRPKLLRWF